MSVAKIEFDHFSLASVVKDSNLVHGQMWAYPDLASVVARDKSPNFDI